MGNIQKIKNKNKIWKIALIFVIFCVGMCSFFCVPQTNAVALAEYELASGDLTNNIIFVNFDGEDSSLNFYQNSYTTFNTMFNTGEYSVREYYKYNSNNNLDMTADIISENNQDIKVFTLDKAREYYMPYLVVKDNTYTLNSNGYFDYYLISGTDSVSGSFEDILKMFATRELIAKVYYFDDTYMSTSAPTDSDISDKILSYDEAVEYVEQNGNCTIVSSYERYIREYMLLCNAMEKAQNYMNDTNSDKNNDGIIDCFSIALLDDASAQKYDVQWADLLWAHQVDLSSFGGLLQYMSSYLSMLSNYGYSTEDIQILSNYATNTPTTKNSLSFGNVYMSNYEITNLDTQDNWESFVVNNKTTCHELGHVLGLPDLYTGSSDTSSMGSFSHMCNSHTSQASYFTSYEREKLGWLNENNVKTIENGGYFTVNAVQGYDNDNVVAYKYNIPNTNEWVYFEYRMPSKDMTKFDDDCGNKQGLLVYTVNKDYNGNHNTDNNYEIYVQRNDSASVRNATLAKGESLGNVDKSILKNIIKYSIAKDGTSKNTGLKVSVSAINGTKLTFRLKSNDFTVESYDLQQNFGGNEKLYKKLLAQSTDTSKLFADSFVDVEQLDISSCDITNLDFLNLFDLSTVKYINLCDNYLQNDSLTNLTSLQLERVLLSNNCIDFSNLSTSLLTNSVYEWGIQTTSKETLFVNDCPTISFYYTQTGKISSISANGTKLSVCETQFYVCNLNTYGEYEFIVEINDDIFGSFDINYTFQVIGIFLNYDSDNPLKLTLNSTFPSIDKLLTVYGISIQDLTLISTLPNIESVGDFTCVLKIEYAGYTISAPIYYKVVAIKLGFSASEDIYAIDEEYTEPTTNIYEDNILTKYTYENLGNNQTYYIEYYEIGDIETKTLVQNISTKSPKTYLIKYIITTSFGENYIYERTITVSEDVVKSWAMNEKLYKELLGISNKKYVYKSDFGQDIDLSSKDLDSISGLELILLDNITVNLCDNNLSSYSELDNIKNTCNAKLLLVFNNFAKTDKTYSNFVFGLQNVNDCYISKERQTEIGDICSDYSKYFNFEFGTYKIEQNKVYLSTFGKQIECKFTLLSTGKSYQKLVDNIYVGLKNDTIEKEYSSQLKYNFDDYFGIEGVEQNELTLSNNYSNIASQLTKVGEYKLNTTFTYKTNTLTHSIKIIVKNTTELDIISTPKTVVYVQNQQQYNDMYANDVCVFYDDYENKNIEVKAPQLNLVEYKKYEVTFTAVGSSNIPKYFTREVVFGNVELYEEQTNVQLNEKFILPIFVTIFEQSDIEIKYTVNSKNYIVYDTNSELSLSNYGENKINIIVSHKQNENIEYSLDYIVNVIDDTSPTIILYGQTYCSLYAGAEYKEYGYKITDNCTDQILTNENQIDDIKLDFEYYFCKVGEQEKKVEKLDSSKVGIYKIVYIATDKFQNSAQDYRYVEVVYADISEIEIDQTCLLPRYSLGKKVEFCVNATSQYIINPDFQVNWYINNELVKTSTSKFEYKFEQAGEYVVKATLTDSENIYSQEITITIYEKSPYENMAIYIGIGIGAVVVISFAVFFINVYRKRNFY